MPESVAASPLSAVFGPEEKRLLQECIHCGFCLPACPTYMENGKEMDSPRGRLYLMESALDGTAPMDGAFDEHIELCLVCRACETACPSGVQFGHLMEITRGAMAEARPTSLLQRFLLRKVLISHRWLSSLFSLIRIVQFLRLDKLAVIPPFSFLLPRNLRTLQTSLPRVPARRFSRSEGTHYGAVGEKQGAVTLFTGCVMDHLFPHVHAATVRLLRWRGYDVTVPAEQSCCGALHAHSGDSDMTEQLADSNRNWMTDDESSYFIINSAGCGTHLKSYSNYDTERIADRVVDLSEFLATVEMEPVSNGRALKVSYDEPCHLLHGQGISTEPKSLLSQVPGLELKSLRGADRCCGSAGSYSITETEMSLDLLERKMDAVEASGAEILVTANPGCQIQLEWGVRRRGLAVEVLHIAQLLDRAYSGMPGYPTEPSVTSD